MKDRKDLWTAEEDKYLMETVQEYTSNGDTKTSAFKNASKQLGRTVSACQYRWNAVLKNKSEATALSPHKNHQVKPSTSDDGQQPVIPKDSDAPITNLNQVIQFLTTYAKENPAVHLEHEKKLLTDEYSHLKEENERLKKMLEEKKMNFSTELEKYESMAKILGEANGLLKREGMKEKRVIH